MQTLQRFSCFLNLRKLSMKLTHLFEYLGLTLYITLSRSFLPWGKLCLSTFVPRSFGSRVCPPINACMRFIGLIVASFEATFWQHGTSRLRHWIPLCAWSLSRAVSGMVDFQPEQGNNFALKIWKVWKIYRAGKESWMFSRCREMGHLKKPSHQPPGTKGNSVVPSKLDPSILRSLDKNPVRQCYGLGPLQPSGKQTWSSLSQNCMFQPCDADNLSGIENWQTDFLSYQHLDLGN